ncbi:DUF2726 domain-containing protein [Agarivorans sp. 1_MG-2023]|uniref:DUF2726 domain-containing protein n=1 Tax=Agarivorans sp. 1_MG-2023 TaxID=3062634 RepID=UPI0026E4774F|nr:DUF2726 domain-containing protein [Agarivorans sp. 1_MG-2023]MDO6763063.1 DUF2726 domain-containing protein [Agarivorans sp. 1_MG-2023]
MEDFYSLIQKQRWGEILKLAKDKQSTLKGNQQEWVRICEILELEFLKYAENEKLVLVSELSTEYLKLFWSEYIILTTKGASDIETLGIRALQGQKKSIQEILAFAKMCRCSPLAKQLIKKSLNESDPIKQNASSGIDRKYKRLDWLTPLFKSELETTFYEVLKDLFPSYFIYPNVALSNIFEMALLFPSLENDERDFYYKGIVDFVLYDPIDKHLPKYFFEVDSFYHDTPEAKGRDSKKNAIFAAAGIELIRIRPDSNTDSSTLKNDFKKKVLSEIRINIQ